MKSRLRILLAGAFAIGSAACAASGGGGAGAAGGAARPQAPAQQFAQGEDPVENGFTRDAERQLGIAMIQQGDAARAAYEAAAQAAERGIAADARNPLPYKQAGQAYIGLGQYEKAMEHRRHTEISYAHAHNNALQIAAEAGLPALALWLWWLVEVIRLAVRPSSSIVHRSSVAATMPQLASSAAASSAPERGRDSSSSQPGSVSGFGQGVASAPGSPNTPHSQ